MNSTKFNMKHERGAALITVLVIVFIVMTIITTMTVRNYRVIRRLTNQKVMEQAYAILFTAVDFGRAGLATSGATSQMDTLTDLWAQPLPKTTILDNIQMSGYITDEQGKFNLNDLVSNGVINQTVLKQLTNLFGYINVPAVLATNIALYMALPQYQNDIAAQYMNGSPAYRPAGRPLVDLSELLLVKGVDAKWLYKISQYVTLIPQSINYLVAAQAESAGAESAAAASPTSGTVAVNINTAPAEVIAAISNIPLPIAQRITTIRSVTPFQAQQDITSFLSSNGIIQGQSVPDGTTVSLSSLATQSSYFTIHAVVDSGDYEFKWIAFVYRANRGGPQWPIVLWQHPE